jgi:hypothetical protein
MLIFAVHYIIQKMLNYWAPRQSRPIYYLHGSQPQSLSNGFITTPLSPVKPVTTLMALSSIVDRLQQFTVHMLGRFIGKLDPQQGT